MHIASTMPQGIFCPLPAVSNLEFCNFTYMCVRDPLAFEGALRVPENLQDIVIPLLSLILDKVDTDDYIYVTVSRKHLQPNTCGNRAGWHVDGFLSDDQSFIWFDKLPTQIALGGFEVSPDHEQSLEQFDAQVDYGNIQYTEPAMLYELKDCVHRPVFNHTNDVQLRTFVKIVISKERFNGIGNAWNYLLPHIKPTKQRGESRNHTVV
ncbi:hypothetical protein vB_AbaP_Acibel007_23 [Acinetobacter phage vB_AbaP_Acibel007]|uniref:Uncharacterized protein n=1 Tax=Acinetobacter phage vB_AbaP_Acibel007 TaxID=1481187 RepID=A0A075DXB2_9CAUD|nr:hypothetical protein vB_AbaP_Acibel007_23 [Acinetobacter phage vB_AbaP_Acibel007]AHY26794.1 hypothetical protein vB_AbaP_Acibel007_23 [Acinetobacter phage vB_AbaP_Acibel007]